MDNVLSSWDARNQLPTKIILVGCNSSSNEVTLLQRTRNIEITDVRQKADEPPIEPDDVEVQFLQVNKHVPPFANH